MKVRMYKNLPNKGNLTGSGVGCHQETCVRMRVFESDGHVAGNIGGFGMGNGEGEAV